MAFPTGTDGAYTIRLARRTPLKTRCYLIRGPDMWPSGRCAMSQLQHHGTFRVVTFTWMFVLIAGTSAWAQGGPSCEGLPSHDTLQEALKAAVAEETSGLDHDMWATVVDRDGVVCAVAFSGANRAAQWPGSRVISTQKANTVNAFSLDSLALSTANLYSAVQPGGSLFGLQESNPVDTSAAYKGPSMNYGRAEDPMVGSKIGGVNVVGGGLGVSGDTSCADHNIAWRVRHSLGLDHLAGVAGVSGDAQRPDNIVFD